MTSRDHIQTLTADEFLALPESNLPHELIEGVLYVAPAPDTDHQYIVRNVVIYLALLGDGETLLSPIDVKLDENTVLQPDVLWLASDAKSKVTTRYVMGSPDLVVEILSPRTARRDRSEKYDLYEKHGVKEYWIIDIEGRYLEVFNLDGEKFVRTGIFGPEQTFQSPVLKAQVPVGDFFASLDAPESQQNPIME